MQLSCSAPLSLGFIKSQGDLALRCGFFWSSKIRLEVSYIGQALWDFLHLVFSDCTVWNIFCHGDVFRFYLALPCNPSICSDAYVLQNTSSFSNHSCRNVVLSACEWSAGKAGETGEPLPVQHQREMLLLFRSDGIQSTASTHHNVWSQCH